MIEDNVYRDKIIDAEKSLVKLIKIDNELPSDMASKIVLKIMQNYKYTR